MPIRNLLKDSIITSADHKLQFCCWHSPWPVDIEKPRQSDDATLWEHMASNLDPVEALHYEQCF